MAHRITHGDGSDGGAPSRPADVPSVAPARGWAYAHATRRSLAPPPLRDALVERTRLVQRLNAADDASLVVVSAPAGYGKTTLLTQWAATTRDRTVVWLDIDQAHADPVAFIEDLLCALDEVEPLSDPRLIAMTAAERRALFTKVIPRIGRSLRSMATPFVLVIDEADRLDDPACVEVLEVIAATLAPGSRLALGCRQDPPLRLASLRAGRRLLEVGLDDLAMGPVEADLLLAAMGIRLTADELEQVLDRTEGWPAGLVLAALAIGDDPDHRRAAARLTGGDRRIADYFVEEVLQRIPAEEAVMLTRTSVLDTLTASACSAVLDTPVGPDDLRALKERNRFIVPLDSRGERYRHHHLFAEMLRAELDRREPGLRRELHLRAAGWHEAQGDHLAAVRHLRAADDDDAAARFVWRSLPALQPTGRIQTLRQMIASFPEEEVRARAPLALAMAWTCVDNQSDMVQHWTRLAAAAGFEGPLPGGPASVGAAIDLLDAIIGAGGAAQMARDAARAYESDADDSPWRSLCCFLMGVGAHLLGEQRRAQAALREGADRAGSMFPSVQMVCQSWLAVMRLLDGDRAGAELHVARAQQQVSAARLDDYSSTGLLDSVLALLAARDRDEETSRSHVRHARLMLAHNSEILPPFALMSRILLARAAVQTRDADTARMLLAEAAELQARIPDSPVLDEEYGRCRAAVDGASPSTLRDAASLTTAELRVLSHLPTHLSFREIGERLHLSRFTIKSQAMSVYRKLGVTSRSEAVARARALGLLDG